MSGRIATALKDLRFGGLLNGVAPGKFREMGAYPISSTPYHILPIIFDGVVNANDVLVDVGCGKGRVINWWLSQYPSNQVYGLEIDPDVAARTGRRLRRYSNVTVLAGDVCDIVPVEGTIFFMFNPFDERVMRRFIDTLLSFPTSEQPRRIIYYFCLHKQLFADHPRFRVTNLSVPEGFHPTALIEILADAKPHY